MREPNKTPEEKGIMIFMLVILLIFLVALFHVTYKAGYMKGTRENPTHYEVPSTSYRA